MNHLENGEIEINQVWDLLSPISRRTITNWIQKGVLPRHSRNLPRKTGHEYWYPVSILSQAKRAKELFDHGFGFLEVRFQLLVEGHEIDFEWFKEEYLRNLTAGEVNRIRSSPDPLSLIREEANAITMNRSTTEPDRKIRKRLGDLIQANNLIQLVLAWALVPEQVSPNELKLPLVSNPVPAMAVALNLNKPWAPPFENARDGFRDTLNEVVSDLENGELSIGKIINDSKSATREEFLVAYGRYERFLAIRELDGLIEKLGISTSFEFHDLLKKAELPKTACWMTFQFIQWERTGYGEKLESILGTIDQVKPKMEAAKAVITSLETKAI